MSAAGESSSPRYPPQGEAERAALIRYARETPLVYGAWRHLKRLYKDAEGGEEPEILGTLIGRLDAAPLAAAPPPFTPGGDFQAIPHGSAVLRERIAYLAANSRLHVIDLSDPGQPRSLGECHCGWDRRVALEGDQVYVGSYGFRVIDVSDPTAPRQVGMMTTGAIVGMAAADPYLYLAIGGDQRSPGGLMVVDVSNPARPSQVAYLTLGGPKDLVVLGRYAYLLAAAAGRSWLPFRRAGGGICIIDLADPRQPRVVRTINASAEGRLAGAPGRLCLWSREGRSFRSRLQVFDLPDPSRPRSMASHAFPGIARGVTVAGRTLVVAASSELRLIDLDDPAAAAGAVSVLYGYGECLAGEPGRLVAVSHERDFLVYDLADASAGQRPVQLGAAPGSATMGYMKRRARRCLRDLAGRDPGRFAEVAFHALSVSGRGRPALDPACQWVSVDLLFGGSGRFTQARHGRGPLYAERAMPPRRGREERAPAAWDVRPELAARLCATPDLPWETHVVSLKILRARGQAVPPLSPETLGRFLAGPSPLLAITAAREGAQRILAGEELPPRLAARLFFASGGRARRELAAFWRERAEGAAWDEPFAEHLAALAAGREESLARLAAGREGGVRLTPRRIAAAELLSGPFAAAFAARGGFGARPSLVAGLLGSGREDLLRLASAAAATAPAAAALPWLEACARLPEARQERALAALLAGFRETAFDLEASRPLVVAADAWVREAGWRLLAAVSLEDRTVAALWEEILGADSESPAARTAFDSEAALALLAGARLAASALRGSLPERLLAAREFSTAAFASLARALPAPDLVRSIAAIEDASWARLRDPLLEALADPGWRARFWEAVWSALAEVDGPLPAGAGALARRVLEDAPVADTFLAVDAERFFEDAPPAAGELLLRWIRSHESRFERDSAPLLAAATSALPPLRAWGLARVREVGMDLPFALRLVESGLPEAVEAGGHWFAAIPPGDEGELEAILALCDSPEREARAFGRELLRQRDSLPREEALRRLAEHGDPVTQEFVAGALLERPELARDLADFERQVLRERDRARRAKERVKERQARDGAPDAALLLDLARGRTRRDAEWALEQLARMVAEGEEIDGISIDGPAG
jgi:hypothetical protein